LMNEWSIMRAAFVMSLSYYVSQLFLRCFEDIISSNIVLLANWQKKKTECSDEENKETKTSMDRTFTLFGHIFLFIIIVVIVIALLILNIAGSQALIDVLRKFPDFYIPALASISTPLTYESVKKTISKLSPLLGYGSVDIQSMEDRAFRQLSRVTNNNGEFNWDTISKIFGGMFNGITFSWDAVLNPITKKKKIPNPAEQLNEDAGTTNQNIPPPTPPPPTPPPPTPPPPTAPSSTPSAQ